FTTSSVSSTTQQFSVDVTLTDSNYKLDEKTKTVSITPIAVPQVMIYAVYGAGGNSGASYKNDFIILYNASNEDIDLTDWSLQYATAGTNNTINKGNIYSLEGTIKSYGFYIIVAASAGDASELPFLETADSSNLLNLAASNFQLYLSTTSTQITPSSYNQSSYVDMIGAGTASHSETAAAPAPSATAYIRRKALKDTNDNSADFELVDFTGANDFTFLGEGHRAYNYAQAVLEAQNLNFNSLPNSFTLPMSFEGTAITWTTENADSLSIAADGTVTVNKAVECDGKLIGTIAGYPLGFEFNVFISNKTRLDAPQVSLEHFTLTWTSVPNAVYYDIYIDGTFYTNTTALTYDLYDSNFASTFTQVKSYAITVVAKCAAGSADYVDSLASSAVDLRFADTSNLSNLDTSLVYTFVVSISAKGVWSSYGYGNFFVVDSQSSQGFLVYRYNTETVFNALAFGSKIYISGKFSFSNNMPQIGTIAGVTATGQVDSSLTKITSSVALTTANAGQAIELTGAVVESASGNNAVVKVGENTFNLYANTSYVSDLTAFGELLPGYTLNFTGAVGIYQTNVQVYVTSYEITGTTVSDDYKLTSTLAEVALNSSYECNQTVSLPAAGTTYSNVSLTYDVSVGGTINANTLSFASVEEDATVIVTITATLGSSTKQTTVTLTIKPEGSNTPEWLTSWSTLESGTYTMMLAAVMEDATYVAKNTLTSSKFQTVEASTATNQSEYTFTIIVNKEAGTVQIKLSDGKYIAYGSGTNFKEVDTATDWTITKSGDNEYLLNSNRAIICNSGTNNKPFGPYAASNVGKADYPFLSYKIISKN
ncbi:MAG: lamin tail domain-containing protein, partial [Anaeroplasmataceae bacterium]|nr:lamin tail domain-containing protein [Anaeroplasmataceae bacterium]